ALLRLHILQENYAWAERSSQDFAIAMSTYDNVEAIHRLLQGWEGCGFGKLQRRRWKPSISSQINILDVVEYTFSVFDDTTNLYRDFVENGGDATVSVEKKLVEKIAKAEPTINRYVAD